VPYISPLDKKVHRYFVDFYIKVLDKTGGLQKYLIEIKPERFTKPPTIPARKTKAFIDEVFQYGVNEAKWKAAFEFCQDRNMKFMVLTEKDLGLINGR
jgi:AAA+ ATPase superfamily predicted ATPase